MKKNLWLFCILCLWAFPASAEEDFGSIPQAAAELHKSLPSCNDSVLIEQVRTKVADYFAGNDKLSLIERRHQQLLLRSLSDFVEVPITNFKKEENYKVADKILMTKINNGLNDEDIRLCRSTGNGRIAPVYLLLHTENYQILADILNFLPGGASKSDFFIIYE